MHFMLIEVFFAQHLAASFGNVESVRVLLGAGADASLPNKEGETALDVGQQSDNPEVVELLTQVNNDQ